MTETVDPWLAAVFPRQICTQLRSPLEHAIEVLNALTTDMRSFLTHYQQEQLTANDMASRGSAALDDSIELWCGCVQDCLYALHHLPHAPMPSHTYSKLDKLDEPVEKTSDVLTAREREIVLLLAQGVPVKETARRLKVSEKTVRNHLSHLYQKLNINDRTQLVIYALKKGLIGL